MSEPFRALQPQQIDGITLEQIVLRASQRLARTGMHGPATSLMIARVEALAGDLAYTIEAACLGKNDGGRIGTRVCPHLSLDGIDRTMREVHVAWLDKRQPRFGDGYVNALRAIVGSLSGPERASGHGPAVPYILELDPMRWFSTLSSLSESDRKIATEIVKRIAERRGTQLIDWPSGFP